MGSLCFYSFYLLLEVFFSKVWIWYMIILEFILFRFAMSLFIVGKHESISWKS